MIRFQCIHCGGRIAVADDHMDRLARCPECGGVTHPLAEHLNSCARPGTTPPVDARPALAGQDWKGAAAAFAEADATKVARNAASPSQSAVRVIANPGLAVVQPTQAAKSPNVLADPLAFCDNCREPLGKLQKPFEWDGHNVCGPCHRMLTLDKTVPPVKSIAAIVPADNGKMLGGTAALIPHRAKVDPAKVRTHPTELALAVRALCIGLVVIAVTLYLIVSILQSLGYLIMWGAIGALGIAAVYWVRRGFIVIRRKALAARNTGAETELGSRA